MGEASKAREAREAREVRRNEPVREKGANVKEHVWSEVRCMG